MFFLRYFLSIEIEITSVRSVVIIFIKWFLLYTLLNHLQKLAEINPFTKL